MTQKLLQLSAPATAQAMKALVEINRAHFPSFWRIHFDQSANYSAQRAFDYIIDLSTNPRLEFRLFSAAQTYNRDSKEAKKWLYAIELTFSGREYRVFPVPEGQNVTHYALVQFKDWFFFHAEFAHATRFEEIWAVRVNAKGEVVEKKRKSHFLIDLIPTHQSEILLTRTMNEEEYRTWVDKSFDVENHGVTWFANEVKESIGSYPLFFSSNGYWTDYYQFWQRHVQFKVSIADLRLWLSFGSSCF